jgi:hypothetical protein
MSMMKPVDNHTTSMGKTVIIGSRTVGSRGMTALNSLVSRAPLMVHFFLRAANETSPQRTPGRRPEGWKPIWTVEKAGRLRGDPHQAKA